MVVEKVVGVVDKVKEGKWSRAGKSRSVGDLFQKLESIGAGEFESVAPKYPRAAL